MLIHSKVSDEKYIWLRIPRTASKAYGKIFFPDGNYEHRHSNYYHETYTYGEIPAFSVVRHPYTRFVSSVKYIIKKQTVIKNKIQNLEASRFEFSIPCESTESLCDFFNENLTKIQNVFSDEVYKEVFKTNDLGFVRLFFIPQHHYVGYPPVKIFRYEQLEEFNDWIESTLGYNTQHIEKYNSSADELQHIDFENPKLIKTVERLFYNDYTVFDYPFQHLT
jgi:hypothetical protein